MTLLRVGFTEPPRSPGVLVVSYTTVSPLPRSRTVARAEAVCFLWHCPAGRPGLPLTTTLPYGVRTFLGGGPKATSAAARPARPRIELYSACHRSPRADIADRTGGAGQAQGVTFAGEVADYYARFRRGYPPSVTDFLVDELGVGAEDVVVDLGCGTGQLAIPLASRVRHVVGVDPEPDMLCHARRAAREQGVRSTSWMLGSDADLPALHGLLGGSNLAAVTVSCAIHLMDSAALFAGLRELLPAGGRVAVIANGTPIWLQDSAWSRALRRVIEQHFRRPMTATCGTDQATRQGYRAELETAGFTTSHAELGYRQPIDLEWVVGNLYSAMSPHQLPREEDRPAFARRVHDALRSAQPDGDFVDDVRVAVLLGQRP